MRVGPPDQSRNGDRITTTAHIALDNLHDEACLAPPISVAVTDGVRAKTDIRAHALSTGTGCTRRTTEARMTIDENLPNTLKRLRLFGLLARIDEVRNKPWLQEVLAIELEKKARPSLAHRQHLRASGRSSP